MNIELEEMYVDTINDLLNLCTNVNSAEKFEAAKTKCKENLTKIINYKKSQGNKQFENLPNWNSNNSKL